jgi:hypothetical protein
MSDYSEESYYDDLAEQWDGGGFAGRGSGGGGGAKKIKKKAQPTTIGKQRVGGTQAWGSSEKTCPKSCTMKCCSPTAKKTPSM